MKQKKEMTVSEMGRKGGASLRDQRGSEYYRQIGALGRAKHAPDFYQKLAQKSAEARRKRKKEKEAKKSSLATLTKTLLGI